MATLKEAIITARSEPTSERSQKLKAAILAGKMDTIAQTESIDLSAFKTKFSAEAPAPSAETGAPALPEFLQKGAGVIAGKTPTGAIEEKAAAAAQAPSIQPEPELTPGEIAEEAGLETKDGKIKVTGRKELKQLPEDVQELVRGPQKGTPQAILESTKEAAVGGLKQIGTGIKETVTGGDPDISGEGFTNVVQGGLRTMFSPLAGILENVPGGEKLAQIASLPTEAVGKIYEVAAEASGVDINTPEFAQAKEQIMTAFDVGALAAGAKRTKIAPAAAKSTLRTAKAVGEGAQAVGGELLSRGTGISRQSIKTLAESPNKVAEVKRLSGEAAREHVFQKTVDAIDAKILENSETGSRYQGIRESGSQVELGAKFWDDMVADQGLTAEVSKNGEVKLRASGESKVRAAADLKALEDAVQPYYGKEVISSNEFLNFRSDLANAAKFETGKTSASTNASKAWRSKLNENRTQIEGLEQLDAEFGPQIQELQGVRDLIYDKKGNLKDNALQTVNNLTGKGKEAKIKRLEEVLPGITEEIRVVKAIQDVKLAGENKIGTYVRSGGIGAALLTGNIPAAVAVILTNPSIVAGFISTYGKAKAALSESRIGAMTKKIRDGVKLSTSESSAVSKVIQSITDQEVAAFLVGGDVADETISDEE